MTPVVLPAFFADHFNMTGGFIPDPGTKHNNISAYVSGYANAIKYSILIQNRIHYYIIMA